MNHRFKIYYIKLVSVKLPKAPPSRDYKSQKQAIMLKKLKWETREHALACAVLAVPLLGLVGHLAKVVLPL
jgi:hypothetical protein